MQAISFIIFWDFSMFYQIFLLPQVKRCAIITYKHGIYELPHELPNDLRLRILGNYEISGNSLNFIEWWPKAQSLHQNESFVNTRRRLVKNRNQTFLVVRYVTWKLELVSDILWVTAVHISNLTCIMNEIFNSLCMLSLKWPEN